MTKRRQRLAKKRAAEKRIAAQVTRALLGEFAVGDRVQATPKRFFPNLVTVRGRISRILDVGDNQHYPNGTAYEIALDDPSNIRMNNRRTFWAADDMLTHIGGSA